MTQHLVPVSSPALPALVAAVGERVSKRLLEFFAANIRNALTRKPLPQRNAHAVIRRRAAAAGIETKLGNYSCRATGITAYLKNGGTLEMATAMANHASTRTTQQHGRHRNDVSLDEVERIVI